MNRDAIKEFVEKIQWIHEIEAGDFRRKLGLYLNRLEQRVPEDQQNKDFKKITAKIRQDFIFSPTSDLETSREEVIDLANHLLKQ